MGTLKVHHLNCAHITRMKLGGQPLACHVVLVETPKDGLVLVDTGLGLADYADIGSRLGTGFAKVYAKPAVDPSLAAIRQIAAMGFDPRDVRHIVQTHLDLDHVGGLSDFPWAKVHVSATELQAATERKGIKARERYRPPFFEHGPDWQTYSDQGERWFGFESVRGLVGLPAEIFFVPLPGHTMGHCGVVLDTDHGLVLDAGDAFFDPREVNQPRRECALGVRMFQLLVTTDFSFRKHNQDRLRELVAAHPEIEVFAAHDPTAFARYSAQTTTATHTAGPGQ
jgi:glyoxylase-like metal-dependent hydrolase (beta-lactamase superfamily II)